MTQKRTCHCTGECGSKLCLGRLTWGQRCGSSQGTPHLIDGAPTKIHGDGRCHLCYAANNRKQHRHRRRHEAILTGDGQTNSLFRLLAGGGFS